MVDGEGGGVEAEVRSDLGRDSGERKKVRRAAPEDGRYERGGGLAG